MDISGGLEVLPVVFDESKYDKVLPRFVYITENIASVGSDEVLFESLLQGCKCLEKCGRSCSCIRQELSETPFAICSHLCRCSMTCGNRSISKKPGNGLPFHLEVFFEERKGFCVKTLETIEAHTYVCTYVGEIIDSTEARRREDCRKPGQMNYIVCLREYSGEDTIPVLKTIVDPEFYGGVGRFINHSCSPNLEPHLVRIGSALPTVCFYSKKLIRTGEELTFDYGDKMETQDEAHGRTNLDSPTDEVGNEFTNRSGTRRTITENIEDVENSKRRKREVVVSGVSGENIEEPVFPKDKTVDIKNEETNKIIHGRNVDTKDEIEGIADRGTGVHRVGGSSEGTNRIPRTNPVEISENPETSRSEGIKRDPVALEGTTESENTTGSDQKHAKYRTECFCGSVNCRKYLPYDSKLF